MRYNNFAISDRKLPLVFGLALGALGFLATSSPVAAEEATEDLMSLSIEDLMTMEVTSVSKQAEKMRDASAAVFVITQEDIQRSGAENLPELMRMVPGMQVSRLDNNKFAVSARGFNDVFSNKLLVLIDGRSIYTLSFSGVFWENHQLILSDIERIEVIRGPGASLWGANAVGGVINIITKDAAETTGTLVAGETDTEGQSSFAFRQGFELDANAHLRVYGKYTHKDESDYFAAANDESHLLRGGFRFDMAHDSENRFGLQAEMFSGETGAALTATMITPPYEAWMEFHDAVDGGHVMANWIREMSNGTSLELRAYYDVEDRESYGQGIRNETTDVELQYGLNLTDKIRMTVGAGYRAIDDEYTNSHSTTLDPLSRKTEILSGFAQGEWSLMQDRMKLTLGSKFEDHDFTGFETQPNLRVSYAWPETTFWAAASKAVRTPSRMENDFRLVVGVAPPFSPGNASPYPFAVQVRGSTDLESENLKAYEIGLRHALTDQLWIDVTAYHDQYTDILSAQAGAPEFVPFPIPHLVMPLQMTNFRIIDISGFELTADWRHSDKVKPVLSYTYTEIADETPGFGPGSGLKFDGPRHQASIRTMIDVSDRVELDIWGRYVDALKASQVDAYADLTVRLGWKLTEHTELAIVGDNLLDEYHWEMNPTSFGYGNTPAQRSVRAVLRATFGG